VAAETVLRAAGVDGEILDAGCGTGLVGVALAERGARSIDGVDLSPGMIAKAKETGVYRRLAPADLSRPLLLIHGLADDNVVAAHSLQLSSALLAAVRKAGYSKTSGRRAAIREASAAALQEIHSVAGTQLDPEVVVTPGVFVNRVVCVEPGDVR